MCTTNSWTTPSNIRVPSTSSVVYCSNMAKFLLKIDINHQKYKKHKPMVRVKHVEEDTQQRPSWLRWTGWYPCGASWSRQWIVAESTHCSTPTLNCCTSRTTLWMLVPMSPPPWTPLGASTNSQPPCTQHKPKFTEYSCLLILNTIHSQ